MAQKPVAPSSIPALPSLRQPWDHPTYAEMLRRQQVELQRMRLKSIRDFLTPVPRLTPRRRSDPIAAPPAKSKISASASDGARSAKPVPELRNVQPPPTHASPSLTESFQIMIHMLGTIQARGEKLNPSDTDLLEQIAAFLPTLRPPRRESTSPRRASLAPEKSTIMAEMVTFGPGLVDRFFQFAASCAQAPIDHRREMLEMIRDEALEVTNAKKVTIWENVTDTLLIDFDTDATISLADESIPLVQCFRGKKTIVHASVINVPILVNEAVFAIAEINFDPLSPKQSGRGEAMTAPKRSNKDPGTLADAIANVGGLFLRNHQMFVDLQNHNERANAMLEMAKLLARDVLDERILVMSIMKTVRELLEADRCSVFLVTRDKGSLRAYLEGEPNPLRLSINVGIAGHVARTGETVNIKEAYDDPRFNKDVDRATGYQTKTILCMPVEYEGVIVAVAQLVNKKPAVVGSTTVARVFSQGDEDVFRTFSAFVGVCIRNCRASSDLKKEQVKGRAMLTAASMLAAADIRALDGVVTLAIQGAKDVVGAECGSLYLLERTPKILSCKPAYNTEGLDLQLSLTDHGIVQRVAQTQQPELGNEITDDPEYADISRAFNRKIVSVLTLPIKDKNDEVIAIAQLLNKIDEDTNDIALFTKTDLETLQDFAVYMSVALCNSQMLAFAVDAGKELMQLNAIQRGERHHRPSLAKVAPEEIADEELTLLRNAAYSAPFLTEAKTNQFDLFAVRSLAPSHDAALLVCSHLVLDLIVSTGLPAKFNCEEDTLTRYILACCHLYRDVPYHNFFHAVDACQTIHTFLYEGRVSEMLTDVDCFLLFIAILAHDLDHMGLNNSFHLKTDTPLGILSSTTGNSSVLEVHHCNLAIGILDVPSQNVFGGMEPADSTYAIRNLLHCILATDMARHKDFIGQFDDLAQKPYDKGNEEHRRVVMVTLTKAADISNITKPFEISKRWGMAVTEEFYSQGDIEKSRGFSVPPMFDRSLHAKLANGQLGFIKFVGEPFFQKIVNGLFRGMKFCTDNIEMNKARWNEELAAKAKEDEAQKPKEDAPPRPKEEEKPKPKEEDPPQATAQSEPSKVQGEAEPKVKEEEEPQKPKESEAPVEKEGEGAPPSTAPKAE